MDKLTLLQKESGSIEMVVVGWRCPSGKGERLIIIHAGSATGWIPNVGKHFRSKKKSLDYHDEMNTAHFLEWFEYCLIPDLLIHTHLRSMITASFLT